MKKSNKLIRFIPLILAIIAIFLLTVQSVRGTMNLSESFRAILLKLYAKTGTDVSNQWWNNSVGIRRVGHVIEYFILGLCAGIAFEKKWKGLLLCIAVSVFDQIAKIFVPVRHFDIEDLPFDIIGYVSAIAITAVIAIAVKKCKSIERPEESKTEERL